MAKDPGARYQSLEQMRDALESLVRQAAPRLLAREREVGPRAPAEEEAAIREQEVEQVAAMALTYAADGDLELALKIAAKVERLAPGSTRHRELKSYLAEEGARQTPSPWPPRTARPSSPSCFAPCPVVRRGSGQGGL